MNRRGFFYKILSDRTNEKIFIGLQVVILDNAIDNLRSIIHQIIEEKSQVEKPDDKKNFYLKIRSLLSEIIYAGEYGFWDFSAHSSEAEEKFNTWIDEIQASSMESYNVTDDETDIDRISADKRYVSLSILFLFENTETHNKISEEIESINEDVFNDKVTYEALMDKIIRFDFNYLLGDAIFLVPGNDMDGLSWEDIHSEGWEYLKPIF